MACSILQSAFNLTTWSEYACRSLTFRTECSRVSLGGMIFYSSKTPRLDCRAARSSRPRSLGERPAVLVQTDKHSSMNLGDAVSLSLARGTSRRKNAVSARPRAAESIASYEAASNSGCHEAKERGFPKKTPSKRWTYFLRVIDGCKRHTKARKYCAAIAPSIWSAKDRPGCRGKRRPVPPRPAGRTSVRTNASRFIVAERRSSGTNRPIHDFVTTPTRSQGRDASRRRNIFSNGARAPAPAAPRCQQPAIDFLPGLVETTPQRETTQALCEVPRVGGQEPVPWKLKERVHCLARRDIGA